MVREETRAYLREYINDCIRNETVRYAVQIVTTVIDLALSLAIGYELQKLTSDESNTVWTYIEFVIVLILCWFVWIISCCCINEFCINCAIDCYECLQRKDQEEDSQSDEAEEKRGILESISEKMQMVLTRLLIIAIGYVIRKEIFRTEPWGVWDTIEIVIIVIFCLWLIALKCCFPKCCHLKCLWRCIKYRYLSSFDSCLWQLKPSMKNIDKKVWINVQVNQRSAMKRKSCVISILILGDQILFRKRS